MRWRRSHFLARLCLLVAWACFGLACAAGPGSIQVSQIGAQFTATWTNDGSPAYEVWVRASNGTALYNAWVYHSSFSYTLPGNGNYTFLVAEPSDQPSSVAIEVIDYANQRQLTPYFPIADTSTNPVGFSFDQLSQDVAYYLEIERGDYSVYWSGWVYSSTYAMSLPPGSYRWRVTGAARAAHQYLYSAPCAWVYFHVLNGASLGAAPPQALLGTNPLEPSDPRRAALAYPEDALPLPDGRVVISDSFHHVLKVTDGTQVTVLAGTGIGSYNGDGPALTTELNDPTGLTLDPDGNIVFCDTGNFLIRKLDLQTMTISTLYGLPGQIGQVDSNGAPLSAALGYLKLIGYHNGQLYASMQFPAGGANFVADLYWFDDSGAHADPNVWTLNSDEIRGWDWDGTDLYVLTEPQTRDETMLYVLKQGGQPQYLSTMPTVASGVMCLGSGELLVGEGTTLMEYDGGTWLPRDGDFVNVVRVRPFDAASALVVDSDNGAVKRIDLTTFAETTLASNGANPFATPIQVLQQDATHLLVLYNNPSHLFQVDTVTGATKLIAGTGSTAYSISGVNVAVTPLRYPTSFALGPDGKIYVAEQNGIDMIDPGTGLITRYAGAAGVPGFVDGVAPLLARFQSVQGIACDPKGNLAVCDTGNDRIRYVTPTLVTTIAGNGTTTPLTYGVLATQASVNAPRGILAYSGGFVFTQYLRHVVSCIGSDGVLRQVAGVDDDTPYQGEGGFLDGPRLTSEFNSPNGITALNSRWDFLVADQFNERIRRVNSFVSTVAGDGTAGFGENSFQLPGSALYLSGFLYVCDTGNGLLRKIAWNP